MMARSFSRRGCQYAIPLLFSSLFFSGGASGEEAMMPVVVMPETTFSSGEHFRSIAIRLERDDVSDVEVTTWISSRGEDLTSKEKLGQSFVLPSLEEIVLPDGVMKGGKGVSVDFGTPHRFSLPDGVYVEHVNLEISFWHPQRRPIEDHFPRFFRVKDGRIVYITMTEYSEEADPKEPGFNVKGEPEMYYVGKSEGNGSITKIPPDPSQMDKEEAPGEPEPEIDPSAPSEEDED